LRLTANVCNAEFRLTPDCGAYFRSDWRDDLSRLAKGDIVTIVGKVWCVRSHTLSLIICELIRAERDGKQIYPPPGDAGETETGRKKP